MSSPARNAFLLDGESVDSLLEGLPRDKQRRVIEAGNVFPATPSEYGTFTIIPNFMRAFIFRVLSAPEVRAYLHVCMFLGKNPVGYVTGDQITADIGISSKKTVYGHTKKLVELGFLLQKKQAIRLFSFETVNYYQRPAVEFTIAKLLRARKITAGLVPLNANGSVPSAARIQAFERVHGKTVHSALEKMVGREEVERIATFGDERKRADEMAKALEGRLETLIAANKAAMEANARQTARKPGARRRTR